MGVNFPILISTVIIMEGITWCTHKYIMHGFLWVWHKDHHDKSTKGFFEDNDLFFIVFAIPSFLLMFFAKDNIAGDFRFWIGLGIMIYGFLYLMVHDIFIHQRFKIFTKSDSPYFKALRKAHKMHHKNMGKEESQCFGMLWVPKKYFQEYMSK